MLPVIDNTAFGYISISGVLYDFDVLIRLNGNTERRKKKLSKAEYGTSHIISLNEAMYIYEEGAQQLIIGTGQIGYVELSKEAADYFRLHDCPVKLLDTKQAIHVWNTIEGKVIGLFHVTC